MRLAGYALLWLFVVLTAGAMVVPHGPVPVLLWALGSALVWSLTWHFTFRRAS